MSATAVEPLTRDGQQICSRAGAVLVIVQRINAGSFRLSVCYGSTGVEVAELSRSLPSERQARSAARMAVQLFGSGLTVAQALDMLAVFAPAA